MLSALCFSLALAIGSVASDAHAADPATAQALFDSAKKLMSQEKWAEACPKLEESQRLDPGGGTLLHLASCREHEGKTATAWAHYQDALSAAKRDNRKDRAKYAQKQLDLLVPKLHKLRVKVASKTKKLPGLKITRDDTNVGEAQWGEAFPIDPGSHTISAHADGFKAWTSKIEIPTSSGDTNVEVPELETEQAQAQGAPPSVTISEKPPATEAPKPPPPLVATNEGGTQRAIGLAVTGLGVVGLGVGIVFGMMAISKSDKADRLCGVGVKECADREGFDASNESQADGTVATIAFIAGGVLTAGGLSIFFTAPSASSSRGASAGLGFRGVF